MMTMERIVAVAGCEIEGLPRDQHPVDGQLEAATSFSRSSSLKKVNLEYEQAPQLHSQLEAVMLAAECGLGTYRRSLSVVILTGVPRR
jgi:hypothetical protein